MSAFNNNNYTSKIQENVRNHQEPRKDSKRQTVKPQKTSQKSKFK